MILKSNDQLFFFYILVLFRIRNQTTQMSNTNGYVNLLYIYEQNSM